MNEALSALIISLLLLNAVISSAYVTNKICLFESGDLCGWEEVTLQEGEGESGVIKASEANFPLPSVDVNPGNSNGSYFFYKRPEDYLSEVRILQYPRQKFITSLNFSYYISGVMLLSVLQTNIYNFDIISNNTWSENETANWEQVSVQFREPDPDYGIVIITPDLGMELGEAPALASPTLALDNVILTYTLPCDFDKLAIPGNLELIHESSIDIPLGEVTIVQFNGSSPICPNGPFIYNIKENNKPQLDAIFSMDRYSGVLTINATGPHLIAEGVSLGILTVSVYVQESDYLETGNIEKHLSVLAYQQDPIITVQSPTSINVQPYKEFNYTISAQSGLRVTLQYTYIQSIPTSLASNLTLHNNTIYGIIGHRDLVDIVQLGKTPSFTVTITDMYGVELNFTVDVILPNIPPTFSKLHYIFNVPEENDTTTVLGQVSVGDVNEQYCDDITVYMDIKDAETVHGFNFVPAISNSLHICDFLVVVTIALDYEEKTEYVFTIVANDTLGKSAAAMVTVEVLSVNEYAPEFKYTGFIKTTTSYETYVGNFLAVLQASDKDKGPAGELTYAITDGNYPVNFRLNQTSNTMVRVETAAATLFPGEFLLAIEVSDGQKPVKKDSANVLVIVSAGNIDCTNDNFGPPEIINDVEYLKYPIHTDVTINCNYTSFPPAYPIQWSLYNTDSPKQLIKSSDHYDITSNTLQIHGITIADSHIYTCNVSNPCGSVISNPGYFLKVIEYPLPITEFKITQGPFKTHITLSWDPAVATSDMPVDGYIVKLKEGTNKFVIYQNLSYYMTNEDVIKTSGTTLTGLKPGTNYTVKIFTFNIAGQKGSNEILFGTEVSAPRLSSFVAASLTNHTLHIEWYLEYTGGSPDIHMTITIESHEIKRRRRSLSPITMLFDVGVNDNVLVTPVLPYGRSYQITGVVSSEYGSTEHSTTAFIGFLDIVYCPFKQDSSCQWILEEGSLIQASSATGQQPTSDASGDSSGFYVVGTPTGDLIPLHLITYPSMSYLCGFSFYYQVYDNIRLILEPAHGNETLYWASPVENLNEWRYEETPAGELPISLSTEDLTFSLEPLNDVSVLSYVAVDDVTLYFCLPCDISALSEDSLVLSYPQNLTLYMRSEQKLNIKSEVTNCSNPILNFVVKNVIPNQLEPLFIIPNPREGIIIISDITTDLAEDGTNGYLEVTVDIVNADYKTSGLSVSRMVTIPFIVSEKFENCSYLQLCDFENGFCDWILSDQSDTNIIANKAGNSFLQSIPIAGNNELTLEIGQKIINDSFCGLNFWFQTRNSEIQVSVQGLGVIWSSSILEDLNPALNTSLWREVSVYIDIQGAERMGGRMVVMEMVLSDVNINGAVVSIDNVTFHPCIDCQAQECSCISCIQQCTTDPCQTGYYLSLEVNQCQPCPAGYYCTDWRSLPRSCPVGTYSNSTGASTVDICQMCPDGTYSLQTGATSCETCPTGDNPSEHLVTSSPIHVLIVAIVGAVAGMILLSLIILICACYCVCHAKKKTSKQKKREKKMYGDNFLIGLDNSSKYAKGPKTGTVRTASTVLDENIRSGNQTFMNAVYYDSESSDEDNGMITSTWKKDKRSFGKFSKDGTVSSLNSLGSRSWSDTNPFATSTSHSDMSALIELDDEKDHVWEELHKKKKKKGDSKL